MTIKVTYNTTDIYVSETISATYINVSYEAPSGGGGAVWGDIVGTLSDQADLQSVLDAKVPYTGATTNVNLGEFELKAGQMTLDITPTGTASVGTTRWNDTIGSSETTLKGGSVILKNGVDLVARVVNKVSPNTTLTKASYQAVRISGAQGQRLAIELAQANNDNNSADTIGLVTETIAPNQEGFIMTVGQLEGINTTGSLQGETWVDGDVLYLSPTTAGRLTNVKPVAPQHLVIIGYVEYAHANNGKIYVKVMNGWELGELHDVNTTGAVSGQVLKYNGTIWTPSGDVGITSLNGLNATTQTFATGTSGTDFNISSATSTHTFNLPTASGTNRGLLSSTDWTTFNNKQNALTNPITGTGAAGQVSYWSGTNTQTGSNNLFWDNTNGRLGIGITTPLQKLHIVDGAIQLTDAYPIRWGTSNLLYGSTSSLDIASTAFAVRFRFTTGGNFIINSTTDSGQRLQVNGDTLMRGSGNTNATVGFTLQNSANATLLAIDNSGVTEFPATNSSIYVRNGITFGSSNAGARIAASANNAINVRFTQGTTNLLGAYGAGIQNSSYLFSYPNSNNTDAATHSLWGIIHTFNPTSGTTGYIMAGLQPTINQTGGANGVTRGLYVNPTLTAAADWRSIEWSNNSGWGLYGAGTCSNYLEGSLGVGTTSPSTKVHISGTNANLRISRTGTVNDESSIILNNTANTAGGQIRALMGSGGLRFMNFSAVTEYARFTAGDNFHIGTFTADSGEKLQVTGTAKITGNVEIGGNLTLLDADNIIVGTTTGTKIGTATSQKIGFWNATPIVQPTTAVAEAAFVENSGGTAVNVDSTFDGYTMQQVVKALRNAGLLQ